MLGGEHGLGRSPTPDVSRMNGIGNWGLSTPHNVAPLNVVPRSSAHQLPTPLISPQPLNAPYSPYSPDISKPHISQPWSSRFQHLQGLFSHRKGTFLFI